MHFVMQIAKTLRSLIQMRYASDPGQIQVSAWRSRRSVLTDSIQSISCKCGGGENSDLMVRSASNLISTLEKDSRPNKR